MKTLLAAKERDRESFRLESGERLSITLILLSRDSLDGIEFLECLSEDHYDFIEVLLFDD